MHSLDVRLSMVAASTLTVLFACTDNTGLSAGRDGSANPTGGAATGTGGAIPGTGGKSTGTGGAMAVGGANSGGINGGGGKPVKDAGGDVGCPPLCLILCQYGNEVDENGCETCTCKPAPADAGTLKDASRDGVCPALCDLYCPYGNEMDSNSCELCKCKPVPTDAGTTKDMGPIVCPPVCAIYCPNGNVLDSNGCATCKCNPDSIDASADSKLVDARICPILACPDILCAYGYALDGNGCTTCKCNPDPTVCPAIKCKACPFGYLKDASGCDTCNCAPDPGTACANLTSESACNAASTRCRWLVRGCGEPALPATGCYDRTLIDCTTTCPSGTTCLSRSIDPCYNLDCLACGQAINICL